MKYYYACHWAVFDNLESGMHYFKTLKKMKRWLRKNRWIKKIRPRFWTLYKKDNGEWIEFKFVFIKGKEDKKWLKQ